MPSTTIVSQRPAPPTKSGGGGISIKQRLGAGALVPANPKTGPPPPQQVLKPLPKPHPPSWAGLKINKKPSLSISTDVNPAPGHEPSAYSLNSPHPASSVSPNINTSATPSFYRHVIPNETMYVFVSFFQCDGLYHIALISSPPLISQPLMMDEAENFLQEIMPPG